jgi:hypothetical protein
MALFRYHAWWALRQFQMLLLLLHMSPDRPRLPLSHSGLFSSHSPGVFRLVLQKIPFARDCDCLNNLKVLLHLLPTFKSNWCPLTSCLGHDGWVDSSFHSLSPGKECGCHSSHCRPSNQNPHTPPCLWPREKSWYGSPCCLPWLISPNIQSVRM